MQVTSDPTHHFLQKQQQWGMEEDGAARRLAGLDLEDEPPGEQTRGSPRRSLGHRSKLRIWAADHPLELTHAFNTKLVHVRQHQQQQYNRNSTLVIAACV